MAANISIVRSNLVLDSQFGNVTAPANVPTWHMGLSATPINSDGSGVSEPIIVPTGYRRLAIPNSQGGGGSWTNAVNGKKSNAIVFAFPLFEVAPTISGMTGDLFATHWFLSTSATDTTSSAIQYMGNFTNRVWLGLNAEIRIPIGEIVLEFDLV